MTRRIAVAILLTTWTALIVIGVGIYVAAQHVMLTDLDESIVSRALSLPEALGVSATGAPAVPDGDRYLVRNAVGRTLARPTTQNSQLTARVTERRFATLPGGERIRTLNVAIASPGVAEPINITYSTSAERFSKLLNQLVVWLIVIGVVCGVAAAGVALVLSRIALRPLRYTAEQIGAIDELHLDRRIQTTALPPELQPMAGRLNDMLARLQQAFDARQRFLAEASHELRTPVAAISTTIEVALRRPRDAASLTETLHACLADAKALRHLVDWLMQQVRSESNDASEPVVTFDATSLLRDCADSVLRARPEASADIVCHLPGSLLVKSQPGRLRSVIINLLSNAVEYGRPGGKVVLTSAVHDEWVLSVSDNGPGIAADLLPRVFEPFSRGSDHRQADQGHLGLGLAIVSAHVQALGGRCEVQSTPGVGTRFQIILPAKFVQKIAVSEGVPV